MPLYANGQDSLGNAPDQDMAHGRGITTCEAHSPTARSTDVAVHHSHHPVRQALLHRCLECALFKDGGDRTTTLGLVALAM